MLKASVIICTHNRVRLLSSCLAAAARQEFAEDAFEIVVVDNASKDSTPKLCREFEKTFGRLQYVYEPVLGLSAARNAGIGKARGRYVAFLDDDSEPERRWLAQIVSPFERIGHRPMAVGGPILPKWLAPRPDWLTDDLLALILGRNHGDMPKILEPDRFITGGNIAFRRDELIDLGMFNTALGLVGKRTMLNEENELLERLRRRGGVIYYTPEARIRHVVPAERTKRVFFLRRSFWRGVSNAVMARMLARGRPQHVVGAEKVLVGLWDLKMALVGPPQERFWHWCRLFEVFGNCSGDLWRGWNE